MVAMGSDTRMRIASAAARRQWLADGQPACEHPHRSLVPSALTPSGYDGVVCHVCHARWADPEWEATIAAYITGQKKQARHDQP